MSRKHIHISKTRFYIRIINLNFLETNNTIKHIRKKFCLLFSSVIKKCQTGLYSNFVSSFLLSAIFLAALRKSSSITNPRSARMANIPEKIRKTFMPCKFHCYLKKTSTLYLLRVWDRRQNQLANVGCSNTCEILRVTHSMYLPKFWYNCSVWIKQIIYKVNVY